MTKLKHCKGEKWSRKQKWERRKTAQFNATCTHLCWCPGRVPNNIYHQVTRRWDCTPPPFQVFLLSAPQITPSIGRAQCLFLLVFPTNKMKIHICHVHIYLRKPWNRILTFGKTWHCTWCTKIATSVIRDGPQIKMISSPFNTVSDHPEYLILKLRCY